VTEAAVDEPKRRSGRSRNAATPQRAAKPAKKTAGKTSVGRGAEKSDDSARPPAPNPTQTESDVGRMIRQQRKARQLTLAQLAELANVSTSYVSQVERGVANPTLASLKTLSSALGITVGSLLEGTPNGFASTAPTAAYGGGGGDVSVMRSGQRRRVIYPGSNIANELLSPNLRVQMEVISVEAPPGSGSGGHPHTHEGEECGVVIAGVMRFWVDGHEWLLEELDSIYFPSHLPHSWESAGDVDLFAIWIITPPTF
jgi:quercetin dioxygenase-like cupin family protein/ribosome-binding protein aMBF1 (putative translation factor)